LVYEAYEVKKKRKITLSFTSPEKDFFYIYEVFTFTSPEKAKRSTYHYSRGILPVAEEQSRTRGSQSGGVEDQPQCRGLWHRSSPSARSLSRSPSPPPPSFTQSHSPPRSLVRDGQTSPHRPRLVVSRSTCPPLSPSPHANRFVLGTAVINTHIRLRLTYPETGRIIIMMINLRLKPE
jgi:hypothetical protein